MKPSAALPCVVLLLASCARDDEDTATDTITTDPTDTGAPAEPIELSVHVAEWPTGGDLADAEVCWELPSGSTCAATGADGRVSLEVPAGSTGLLTFEAPPLIPATTPIVLGDQDISLDTSLDSVAYTEALYAQAGLTMDPELAPSVAVQVFGGMGAVGDAEVSLIPASGEGPFYLDASGTQFDLDATGTVAGMGVAYFLNVDPAAGPFEVAASLSSGAACTEPLLGVALPALDLRPGVSSYLFVSCL